jgi:hypothetical protein
MRGGGWDLRRLTEWLTLKHCCYFLYQHHNEWLKLKHCYFLHLLTAALAVCQPRELADPSISPVIDLQTLAPRASVPVPLFHLPCSSRVFFGVGLPSGSARPPALLFGLQYRLCPGFPCPVRPLLRVDCLLANYGKQGST